MFALADLTRSLGGNRALRGIHLRVADGERIAVLGPSGAGKTTLFNVLNLTLRPDGGEYCLRGRNTATLTGQERRAARTEIATIHQQHDIVPRLTVLENVLAGRLGRWGLARTVGARLWPRKDDVEAVRGVLGRVGLAGKIDERSDRLSGGQQQRVAIARALFQDAKLILADEPVASVDPGLQEDILRILVDANERDGRTLVVNLHQPDLARRYFPRIVALREGAVAFDAPASQVSDAWLTALFAGDAGPAPGERFPEPVRIARPACRPTDVVS